MKTEALNALIFNISPDAIIVTDSKGIIIKANEKTTEIFGYPAQELVGKTIEILLPEELVKTHRHHRLRYFKKSVKREMGAGLELYAKHKDGKKFSVEISLSPFHINDELYVSAFIRDISKSKQINEKLRVTLNTLEAKNEALEKFAYIASHDLKGPLKNIVSLTNLLRQETEDELSENADQYFNMINESAIRLQHMISGLLEYSRIGQDFEMTELDCNQILEDVQTDLQTIIQEDKIQLKVDNLPKITGHEISIRQVFQNIISNAIKFRRKSVKTLIEISASRQEKYWLFCIRDNGIGMSSDQTYGIFNIFYRLHHDKEYEGSGIGLAHCKNIIESHKGKIWVKSTLGEGSAFYFSFPLNFD